MDDDVTYSRDALDGVITDLCQTLGLDRRRIIQITIMEGVVIAQLSVTVKFDDHPTEKSTELRKFEYDAPH